MKNKIQEKVERDLQEWYHKKNGEVTTKECFSEAISRTIELMEEEFDKMLMAKETTILNSILNKRLKEQKADFRKMIEDVDIELMFTDIKDKDGDMFANSKEVMEVIEIWWNDKSKELLKKLGDDKVNKK